MNHRTRIVFEAEQNFGQVFEDWAKECRFRLKKEIHGTKVYQKGVGFLVAPMMVSVRKEQGKVHLEAWVRCMLFVRICALFLLPREMGIESGGFRLVFPRKILREQVNSLLHRLSKPLIA